MNALEMYNVMVCYITPENAFAQILNVSEATGIPINALRTILELSIERNKVENLLAFALIMLMF